MTHKIWNDPPTLADVRWEGSVLCLDIPKDPAEELERIASERYGIGLEDLIRCYLYWIVENPEDFKKWISQWME